MFRRLFASCTLSISTCTLYSNRSFSPKIRTGLNIAVALNALLSLAVPTVLIGVCKGAMMHCHMVTRPTLIVIGILALLFAVVAIYLDSKPVKR